MPDCPIIPVLPGVPPLFKLPPIAVLTVNQGLSGCSGIMSGVSAAISASPGAALSTVASQILGARNALGPVNTTLAAFSCPVFSPLLPPVGLATAGLSAISSVIAGNPSGALSMIASSVGGVLTNLAGASRLLSGTVGLLAGTAARLLGADLPGIFAGADQMPWGIYKDGQPVIEADSTISMDYRKEYVISDYQVEGGGFATYDKVEMPYEARVRMATGGSNSDRDNFLASIEAIIGDTEFYDVVTPERVYVTANLTHYDYRRTSTQGLGLMQVDITLIEVRETAEEDFTTAAPSGAATKNGGTVQAAPPTAPQQSALHSFGF